MKPILCQRSAEWKDKLLGSSKLKIGDYGCTSTAIAEVNNLFGAECTPADVAAHKEWYTKDGLILWPKLNLQKANFIWRHYNFNPAIISQNILDRDKAVLLEVNMPRANKHWLFAEAISDDGQIFARDPWTGYIVNVFQKYGAVTGFALFSRK